MKPDDKMYGRAEQEVLQDDVDSVLEGVLEDACDNPGEPFDAIAARIEWPIRVSVFRHMDLGGEKQAENIAQDVLERTLEILDEEHADPDGDATEPSEGMKAAALAFGRAVVKDYVSWACEPTGEVLEFTRAQMAEREKATRG